MSNDNPKKFSLVTLPVTNLRDISSRLRGLADSIDNGDEGKEMVACMVVLEVSETGKHDDGTLVKVYGYGDIPDTKAALGLLRMGDHEVITSSTDNN